MFIRFLAWIRPTDGNYSLARKLKKVIQKVVDHILDPPRQPQPSQATLSPEQQEFHNQMLLEPLDANTIDWLNTIDWTQGTWTEFS